MLFIGVRISWLIVARNSPLAAPAAWARAWARLAARVRMANSRRTRACSARIRATDRLVIKASAMTSCRLWIRCTGLQRVAIFATGPRVTTRVQTTDIISAQRAAPRGPRRKAAMTSSGVSRMGVGKVDGR